jgi:hypothetical protein
VSELQFLPPGPSSLSTIPRAAEGIRRARGFGALAGFTIALGGTLLGGGVLLEALARGVAGGVVMSLVAWWLAQVYWRLTIRAEFLSYVKKRRQRLEELVSELERA